MQLWHFTLTPFILTPFILTPFILTPFILTPFIPSRLFILTPFIPGPCRDDKHVNRVAGKELKFLPYRSVP